MSETATIRVTRDTRDLLAEQARARGVSLAALLGEIARERETEAIWESERQARRLEAGEQTPQRFDGAGAAFGPGRRVAAIRG